jgi:hypothetical protein
MFAAPANAGSRCERYPDNIARCLVPLAGAEASTMENKSRVAADVLCCCKTFSGGDWQNTGLLLRLPGGQRLDQ